MVAVPAPIPVTSPVVDTTVAMPVAPDVQEPEGVASPSGVVAPVHTEVIPVMAAGAAFTVRFFVTLHPTADV